MMDNLLNQLIKNPIFLRYQMLLLPAAALIVCLLLMGLLVIPQLVKLVGNQSNVATLAEQVKQIESKVAVLESIDTEQVKSDIATSLMALPEERDIPAMIGQLLYLVSTNRLKLEGMSFAAATSQTEGIDSMQVQLSLSGEVADLKEFMAGVKRSARIIKVVAIEISGGGRDQIEAQLRLVTYFKKLPTSIGNFSEPVVTLSQTESDLLNEIEEKNLTSPVISSQELTGPKGKPDPFE